MKIALIGASGFIGSALLKELLAREHLVTAFASHPERLTPHKNLIAKPIDVQDGDALTAALAGFDLVLSAFSGHAQTNQTDYYLSGIKNLIAASHAANLKRLLVVGGAGSLEVAPGVQLIDTPSFPAEYKASAEGARQALNLLRQDQTLNWTMLSPSAMIAPGERTGIFRVGSDQLLSDAQGKSHISLEDYAMAMVNELEQAQFSRQRFTVGY